MSDIQDEAYTEAMAEIERLNKLLFEAAVKNTKLASELTELKYDLNQLKTQIK